MDMSDLQQVVPGENADDFAGRRLDDGNAAHPCLDHQVSNAGDRVARIGMGLRDITQDFGKRDVVLANTEPPVQQIRTRN